LFWQIQAGAYLLVGTWQMTWNWSPEEAVGKQVIYFSKAGNVTVVSAFEDYYSQSLKDGYGKC
jgi:hypothetical protein